MSRVTVVGLGPAGLDLLPTSSLELLTEAPRVIVRTSDHPAASELSRMRAVEFCDDLYEQAQTVDEAYQAIVERVISAAPVTYAVPGSPLVGESTVRLLRLRKVELEVVPAPSFLDLVVERLGIDPLANGFQILDGHALPQTMSLDRPTVIAQVDTPGAMMQVKTALDRLLDPSELVTVLVDLGAPFETVAKVAASDLGSVEPGPRLTLALDKPISVGWPGLVEVTRRLRVECPWDAKQTHHSLVRHLIEEAHELVEAVSRLSPDAPAGDIDAPSYVELEDELGDVLLQVVFHANLANEAGAFDIDEVSETLRRKLVRRHPHVFGDVDVADASEVEVNWERLKQEEKNRESLMDDVPGSLPSMARAAKLQRRAASVGFDWARAEPVIAKLREEVSELERAADNAEQSRELGDVLFTVVNLGRHLGIDPETALRQAADRFSHRFRQMERAGDLASLTSDELEALWESVKAK